VASKARYQWPIFSTLDLGQGGFGRRFRFNKCLCYHHGFEVKTCMPDQRAITFEHDASPDHSGRSPQAWRKLLAPYSRPDGRRAAIQLLNTGLPLLASAAALFYGLSHGFCLAALFAVPAALFLVRLFALQHDCGHGSFFGSSRLNNALGRIMSMMTLIPYNSWRRDHATHHATAGNLDRRGTGDITTLTVREYLSRPAWQKLLYRFYRNPLVIFGIGTAYILLVRYRVPTGRRVFDWNHWFSILGTDAAAAAGAAVMAALVGPITFLAAWGAVLLLATAIGVWFFYVQHQFEDAYWERSAQWKFHDAALAGSSYYDLPRPLHWLTGSIGFHHIHHLAGKIPNYRLRACFEQNPELRRAKRLTLWDSVKSVRLALWDEERRKLVPFRHQR